MNSLCWGFIFQNIVSYTRWYSKPLCILIVDINNFAFWKVGEKFENAGLNDRFLEDFFSEIPLRSFEDSPHQCQIQNLWVQNSCHNKLKWREKCIFLIALILTLDKLNNKRSLFWQIFSRFFLHLYWTFYFFNVKNNFVCIYWI